MMRLSPENNGRIAESGHFVKHAGGSELNVLSGISRLGLRAGLISKLPATAVGQFVRSQIRSYGVSDDYLLYDDDAGSRLGIYYYESGSYPRKPQVIYDRAGSSFTGMKLSDLDPKIFSMSEHFHTSGISLALCGSSRETAISLIKGFKEAGATISFDVNYRAGLWCEEEAKSVICSLLPYIDILFVSEESSRRMMGKSGSLFEIQKSYSEQYGVSVVASTLRTVNSPRSHNFSSQIYSSIEDEYYTEAPYNNIDVVDRIGSGDAYVSGVLYACLSGKTYDQAVSYGNAMSSLKSTVHGDLLATDLREVDSLIKDHNSKGIVSEMNR